MNNFRKIFIAAIIILVAAALIIQPKYVSRRYQVIIDQNEQAMKGLHHLADSLSTQYLLVTSDLNNALYDNETLRSHINQIEKKYGVKVTEASNLAAFRDSVLLSGPSLVVQDTTADTGVMFITADTLGVSLDLAIRYPDGEYQLSIGFVPLDLIVTVEKTKKGLERHTAYFPKQPWYRISDWKIIVEQAPIESPSFVERLIGNIRSIGIGLGGGAGPSPVGIATISIGDVHIGLDSAQHIILLRTFKLFN